MPRNDNRAGLRIKSRSGSGHPILCDGFVPCSYDSMIQFPFAMTSKLLFVPDGRSAFIKSCPPLLQSSELVWR